MANMIKSWHVDPGVEIVLPEGSERMRSAVTHEIWYSPHLDHSYLLQGHNAYGWDVYEYDSALCGRCQERREQFRERGF